MALLLQEDLKLQLAKAMKSTPDSEQPKPGISMDEKQLEKFQTDLKAEVKGWIDAQQRFFQWFLGVACGVMIAIGGWLYKASSDRATAIALETAASKTQIELLKSADIIHDRQLAALDRTTTELRETTTQVLLTLTEQGSTLATIKEATRATSDRLEGLSRFLREASSPRTPLLGEPSAIDRRRLPVE